MVIAPALIKPNAMILVAALLCTNAVAAVPIPIQANLLSLIFFNNLLNPRPVDFFKPEDIMFIPTMNTAAPTNNEMILVTNSIRLYLRAFIRNLQLFKKITEKISKKSPISLIGGIFKMTKRKLQRPLSKQKIPGDHKLRFFRDAKSGHPFMSISKKQDTHFGHEMTRNPSLTQEKNPRSGYIKLKTNPNKNDKTKSYYINQ